MTFMDNGLANTGPHFMDGGAVTQPGSYERGDEHAQTRTLRVQTIEGIVDQSQASDKCYLATKTCIPGVPIQICPYNKNRKVARFWRSAGAPSILVGTKEAIQQVQTIGTGTPQVAGLFIYVNSTTTREYTGAMELWAIVPPGAAGAALISIIDEIYAQGTPI